ncbi:MAG TPA: nitrilase-related carbon-nitrogen hydrolase, partial [bacterium]|nr:nitrilase-related carbon-nitrogen hydrolase [bacterium]
YDVRFFELFRIHVVRNAELALIFVDFILHTGKAHWELLVRAWAVENQMFVVAPNQAGSAPGTGASYGHSLIIGPWGEILAACGDETEGIALADLDLSYLRRVRTELPVLQHRKPLRWVRNRL